MNTTTAHHVKMAKCKHTGAWEGILKDGRKIRAWDMDSPAGGGRKSWVAYAYPATGIGDPERITGSHSLASVRATIDAVNARLARAAS